MEFKDKAVTITGAYGGLGAALAERLADAGAYLLITGKDEAKLNALADRLRKKTKVVAVKADLRKDSDCKSLIDACVKAFGRLDVMINNAGVLEEGLEAELVDKIIDVNLKALEYCSYYAVTQMERQGEGGVLVNISSTSGVNIKPRAAEAIYASTKFGVVAYSGTLHQAYKDGKIKVMCFCPGGMKTDLFRKNPERMLPEFMDPSFAAGILLKYLESDKYGLLVFTRKGILQYSEDYALSWKWTHEETIDMKM